MNKALPPISESVEELKSHLRQETHGAKKQRLHALYLLKSGQARSRLRVAELLGVNRNTVGTWLDNYQQGGLTALLKRGSAPGRQPTLQGEQLARLQEALAQPEGFSSYQALQEWIARELGVEMPYKTVHDLVHYRLGAKLKRPRPQAAKKK